MSMVYDLWFVREYVDRRETELHIGIYASRGAAQAAIDLLKTKPGFRDHPDGFEIFDVELDRTGWQCGFITEFGAPPTDAEAEPFDLPAFD